MARELTGTFTRVGELIGTLTTYISEMSAYFVHNRFEITGLTGGTSAKLDGFDISNLKTGNPIVAVFFTGSIVAFYRLRANAGGEAAVTYWKVLSTNDPLYLWELISVQKQGCPCGWNATTSKFHQTMMTGAADAVSQVIDQTGFVLPVT